MSIDSEMVEALAQWLHHENPLVWTLPAGDTQVVLSIRGADAWRRFTLRRSTLAKVADRFFVLRGGGGE